MTSAKQAFIFDPCMGSMTGHWENFCRRLSDELTGRDIKTTIFCQEETRDEIIRGLDVVPIFTRSPFADINSDKNFTSECKFFEKDFAKIDKSVFDKDNLLIFPTIFPQTLKPMMEWCSDVVTPDKTRAAIIFQFPAGDESEKTRLFSRQGIKKLLYRPDRQEAKMIKGVQWNYCPTIGHYLKLASGMRNRKDKQGYFYFSSSPQLGKNFSNLLDIAITPLPMPAPDIVANNNTSREERDYIKIGYFGHSSLAKGAQFLQEIIRRTGADYPRHQFSLHINPNPDTEKILEPFKDEIPNVTCKHGHISQQELFSMIGNVDITLMPYDPAKYTSTPSAIFTECVAHGNVMVIPQGTWMEKEAKKSGAGHICFSEFTAQDIYHALNTAISRYDELKKTAQKARQKFLGSHNVKLFIDKLLDYTK